MRIYIFAIIYCLALANPGLASDGVQEQLQQQEERISNLEQRLEALEYQLSSGQQNTAQRNNPVNEPLIGRWDCTNGAFRSEIYFEPNGNFLQKDAVLGETRTNRWTRMGSNKVALKNGISFQLEFYTDDHFTVEDTNTRSTWDCYRLEN